MKKIILTAAIFLVFTAQAFAVTLAWDDNSAQWTEQGVLGIRLYWDDDISGTTKYVDVPRPNNMVTIDNANFMHGTAYNFWATAYNSALESPPSNVVVATFNWDNTWGDPNNNGAPTPATPVLRLSPTTGGYVVPNSAIKTAP